MNVNDFLSLRTMITPTLIRFLFLAGVALSVLVGLFMVGAGMFSSWGGGGTIFAGLLWIVFGPLLVRLYCELMIVIFSINDHLLSVRDSLGKSRQE